MFSTIWFIKIVDTKPLLKFGSYCCNLFIYDEATKLYCSQTNVVAQGYGGVDLHMYSYISSQLLG